MIALIGWGPIESLSNGYFIRVYALTELISKRLNKSLVIIEYSEDLTPQQGYKAEILKGMNNVIKVSVLGNEKSVTNTFVKYMRFMVYQLINTFKLRNLMSRVSAVIVGGELFLPSLLTLRLLNKGLIIIADPHMLLSEREQRKGRNFLAYALRQVEKIYFKKSDFIVAISKEMKDKIVSWYHIPPSRIIIIPHILPKKLLRIPSCPKRGLSNKPIRLAFVGSLRARQNLEAAIFLISIMPILMLGNRRPLELMLIGSVDGKEKKLLEEISSKKGVSNRVKILGYVQNLDDTLCKVDVLLAPMFITSGVSTKVIYYLRFKDKIILISKEATEGLEKLIKKSKNVIVAEDPKDFVLKLMKIIKNLDLK